MKTLIYCTKAKPKIYKDELWKTGLLNGKVVASFDFDRWVLIENRITAFIINKDPAYTETIAKNSCIGFDELKKYLGTKSGYAWHIDDLQVFDVVVDLLDLTPVPNKNTIVNGIINKVRGMQYVYYKSEKCLLLPIKSKRVYKDTEWRENG